ncbi:MAG TPA: F0F1 ATP synthase subunit B [Polyangia bacterium]|nr:F0F1 ATP synthase subunit B [Polyangia bacterium]
MRRVAFVALFLALLSSPSLAQPGGESPEGGAGFPAPDVNESEERGIQNWWTWDYKAKHLPPPFGFALVNFGIFALIMYRLAGKPLKNFVAERHSSIRKDLDEASRLRKEAEAKLHEYEQKVSNVEAEIDSLVKSIQREAEAEKERILAAAAEQATRLKADAQKQIEAEIARARSELRRGVIEAAVAAADEILKQQIGADDQRKMAERYVTDLEKTTALNKGTPS